MFGFFKNFKSELISKRARQLNEREKTHKEFLEKNKDANFSEAKHYTPEEEEEISKLHKAVYTQNINLAKEIIDSGHDVNLIDKLGKTALHYAARDGQKEIIKMLIQNGANQEIKDFGGSGGTPREIAEDSGHLKIYDQAVSELNN